MSQGRIERLSLTREETLLWRTNTTEAIRDAAKKGIVQISKDVFEYIDIGQRLECLRNVRIGRVNRLQVMQATYDRYPWFGDCDEPKVRRLRIVNRPWDRRAESLRSAGLKIASIRSIAAFFITNLASTSPFPFGHALRCLEQDREQQYFLIKQNRAEGFCISAGLNIDRSTDIGYAVDITDGAA